VQSTAFNWRFKTIAKTFGRRVAFHSQQKISFAGNTLREFFFSVRMMYQPHLYLLYIIREREIIDDKRQ